MRKLLLNDKQEWFIEPRQGMSPCYPEFVIVDSKGCTIMGMTHITESSVVEIVNNHNLLHEQINSSKGEIH